MPATPACPDCGAPMKLRAGRFGQFFGCSCYPECRGLQKANERGEPVGLPANVETRKLRRQIFERLKEGNLERSQLPKPVSQMDADDCRAVLNEWLHDPEPISFWEILQEEEAFERFYGSKP